MSRRSLPQNYVVDAGTLFEDFETLSDWTRGASGVMEISNSIFKTGSASLKLTSPSGGNCSATKTISQNFQNTGVHGIWMYIEDVTKVLQVIVYLSDDSAFTNYNNRTMTDLNTGLFNGWNFLPMPRADWGTTGTGAFTNTKVRLRVRVDAVASQVAVVYFDSYYHSIYSRPKLLLTFDDGVVSQYTEAYSYMSGKGLKGTCYLVGSYIDTTNYMTSAQISTLYTAGWDLANHTYSHINLTTLDTQAAMQTDLTRNVSFLEGRGYSRASTHVAYPNGGYDTTVLAAMNIAGLKTGRTTISAGTAYQPTSGGLFNPLTLKTQSILDTTTLAQAKSKVDLAISSGTSVIMVFHKLVVTPAAQTEWPITDFQALIDYIVTKQTQLDVVTVSEWYAGLTNPRKSTR